MRKLTSNNFYLLNNNKEYIEYDYINYGNINIIRKFIKLKNEDNKNIDTFIKSSTQFNLVAKSKTLNIPIYAFGYGVSIGSINYKHENIGWYEDIEYDSGESTKKYFKNKEDRQIVFKYITKDVEFITNKYTFPIIVRGVINEFKANNYRYHIIENILTKYYVKFIIDLNNTSKEHQILKEIYNTFIIKNTQEKQEAWIYILKSKQNILMEEININLTTDKSNITLINSL